MKTNDTWMYELTQNIQRTLASHGVANKARDVVGHYAMESLSDSAAKDLDDAKADFSNVLEAMFNQNGDSTGSKLLAGDADPRLGYLKQNSLAAAGYAALALGDPTLFATKALESRYEGTANARLVTPSTFYGAGSFDYRDQGMKPAMEAFDNKNLTDFMPYSIAFNIYGQRQDEFSEFLFKTFVVPPEQAGIELSASRLLVFRDQNHTSGAYYDMGKRNLIQAHVDATLLKDESTRLVPVAAADGSNDPELVSPTLVATRVEHIAGVDVPTRPYKTVTQLNLLGLSQYQPLVGAGAQFDNQDAIDSAIRLSKLVISTTADDSAPAIVIDTRRFSRNQFQRSLEGNYRQMTLAFETAGIVFNKATTAVDGSAVAALAALVAGEYTATVGVEMFGSVNLEKGNLQLTPTRLVVTGLWDKDMVRVSTTAAGSPGKAIADAIAGFKVEGFELEAQRTNSNRRTRGLRLDTTLVRERHYIPLGSPLSVARPNEPWQQNSAVDLKAIVTAARIRNTNNAVTALLNTIDNLRAYKAAPFKVGEDDSASIGGLGRLIIDPFFYEDTLDLVKAVNSVSSADKAEDISQAIVNKIRDASFTMLRDSNYQPALEAQVGGPSAKPTLFVGTDQRLIRHIMVTGDNRTFTPMFDSAVVKESLDSRMHDTIVLTFVRPEATAPDVLSFGAHLWSTELVSTLPVVRSGESHSIETMVQPRTLHINMMPVVAVIHVTGLETVLGTAIQYNTHAIQ